MRTIKFFAAAFAMLAAVACAKDDSGKGTPETFDDIYLKVKLEASSTVKTKGEVAPVPGAYKTSVDNAYIYVLNLQGKVIADAEYTINDVTGNANHIETTTEASTVLVVANYDTDEFDPTDFGASAGGTRKSIEEKVFSLEKLAPAPTNDVDESDNPVNLHGVRHAMLYNYSDNDVNENISWSKPAVTDPEVPAEWAVTVKIAPVVARFEISEVSGTATLDAAKPNESGLKSYTLAGIFINNTYSGLTLKDGVKASGNPIIGQSATDLNAYPWAKDEITGAEDLLTYEPATGKVWAYHLAPIHAADNTPDLTDPLKPVYPKNPWIILHLQDVVYDDGSDDGIEAEEDDLYVAVRSYTKNGDPHGEFLRGRVYQIPTIKFNKSHITNTPNPQKVNLTVGIDVLEWQFEPIEAVPGN